MFKRIIVFLCVLGIVMLEAGSAFAGGFENNPDRYPSIGLSLGLLGLSGDSSIKGAGVSDQDVESGTFDITIDTIIPVSPSLSLFGAFSLIGQNTTGKENADFFESETDLSGFGLRLGARMYFNQ